MTTESKTATDCHARVGHTHRHVLVALPVAANHVMALLLETLREVRRDEATGARDANPQLLLGPVGLGAVHTAELVAGSGHLGRNVRGEGGLSESEGAFRRAGESDRTTRRPRRILTEKGKIR